MTLRNDIERMKAEGLAPADIAAVLGCTRANVYYTLAHPLAPRAAKAAVCKRCGVALAGGRPNGRLCAGCRRTAYVAGAAKRVTAGANGPKANDLTGRTVGRWTVLRRAAKVGTNGMWWCRCGCGREQAVTACRLLSELRGRTGFHSAYQCLRCHATERVTKACKGCGVAYTGAKQSRYCTPKCRCKHY